MTAYRVFRSARITYEWHELIEAGSPEEAQDLVKTLVEALLTEGRDPYGTEIDARPFFEVDWSGEEWEAEEDPT